MSALRTLCLSPWYKPHKVISWEAAVRLIYQEKAELIEAYDEEIRSPSVTWQLPAVIRLKKPLSPNKKGVKFNRINLLSRDGFRCRYCGDKKSMKELTYDHVIPKKQGGKTNWSNIVSACKVCNSRKGARTPEQAGMRLLSQPFKPKTVPMSYLTVDRRHIPDIWAPYCNSQGIEEDNGSLFLLTGSQ